MHKTMHWGVGYKAVCCTCMVAPDNVMTAQGLSRHLVVYSHEEGIVVGRGTEENG